MTIESLTADELQRRIKLELYSSSIGVHAHTVTPPPRTQPVLILDVIKSDLIKSVSEMETKSNTAFHCFCLLTVHANICSTA